MNLDFVPVGRNPPGDVNVVIEIPMGGSPVKYELDKASGALFVDRFLHTAMHYPANYGFVPHTLAEDGDPIDVLVVGGVAVAVGSVIAARPVGMLRMEDEAGPDEKIVAVPSEDLNPFYKGVDSYTDLPGALCDQIAHFFEHYKDLEVDKWVRIGGWEGAEAAMDAIRAAIDRHRGR